MIKGSIIQQDNTKSVYTQEQNIKIDETKLTELKKRYTNYYTWDFNTSLSVIAISNRQKVSKDIVDWTRL